MTLTELKAQISAIPANRRKTDVYWDAVSNYPILDENFIRTYYEYLNLTKALEYNTVSDNFIRDFYQDIGLRIFKYQNPSETFLKTLAEGDYTLIPDIIFTFGSKVSDTFKTQCMNILNYYQDQDNFEVINSQFWFAINNSICGQSFIETHYDKFAINEYIKRFNYDLTLNETFLNTHFADFDPIDLLKSRKLSESFISSHISTFKNETAYPNIKKVVLRTQDLSVSFITSTLMTNGFALNDIARYCTLTQNFVNTNKANMDLKLLNKETCKNINEAFITSNLSSVDLHTMLSVVNRSVSFLDSLISTIPINPRLGEDISKTNTLTEAFVQKHVYPLFKIHHGEILKLPQILLHNSFSETFIDSLKDHPDMDWEVVLEHQTLSSTFIMDHLDYITPFLEKAVYYQSSMNQTLLQNIMTELKLTTSEKGRLFAKAMKYINISVSTINSYLSYMTPINISRYQIYNYSTQFTSDVYKKNRIVSINFNRDVKVMDPCQEGIDWYTSHWGLNNDVDYNDILTAIKNDKKYDYLDWFFVRAEKLYGPTPLVKFTK